MKKQFLSNGRQVSALLTRLTLLLGTVAGLAMPATPAANAAEPDRLAGIIEPVVAKKPLKIALSVVHLNDDFWKGLAYGVSDEAKRSNATVLQITVAGGYGNVSQQFGAIQNMKTLGADVAIVGAAAFNGYDALFKQLRDSGMIVAAAQTPVNSKEVDFGVTEDDAAIGAAMGKAVCEAKGSGAASAIDLPGPAGVEWSRLREVGFDEAAKACGVTVIKGPVGGGIDIETGLKTSSDLLLKNPDARFIYTPAIPIAMGALQATRQQHREVGIATAAVIRGAIPLIKDGKFLVVVSEPAVLMGRLLVQYAIRKAEKLPMPNLRDFGDLPYRSVVATPKLITVQNAAAYPYELYDLPPENWSIR
jgi:ribose transport system substrate-binding protein